MRIDILENLRDFTPSDGFPNKPLSDSEIVLLEDEFNNGRNFPIVLRELLFIAGKYCDLLEYEICKTQQQIQHRGIKLLQESYLSIQRSYYVIDFGTDGFTFIYLDESQTDPVINYADMDKTNPDGQIYSLQRTLSEFINARLETIKKGYNPF